MAFFGKLAEISREYLHKGLSRRSSTNTGMGKRWLKRYTTEMVVDMDNTMQMLDGRNEQQQRPQPQPTKQQQRPASRIMDDYDSFHDPLPF